MTKPEELTKLLGVTEGEITQSFVKRHTEPGKNTRALKLLRIKRALIKTVIRQHERTGGKV